MFHRQNKSVREIARLTSLSRNTIGKYLSAMYRFAVGDTDGGGRDGITARIGARYAR